MKDAAVPDPRPPTRKGRGSAENLPNRFESLRYERDPDEPAPPHPNPLPPSGKGQGEGELDDDERPGPRTQFFKDRTRSIIAYNDSPDVGFEASVNPYRGCEHGCIYCYARPTHEYLGMSAGLDFETKIIAKEDAPELLRKELASPKWQPQVLSISGVTDPYQPIERRMRITRRCLEVLAEFRNPAAIVTKNHLVTRDSDLLADLARDHAAAAFLSITTLDADLCGVMEPRTSRPPARLQAIRELTAAGIPAGVMVGPVIPGLTDHELPSIIAAAVEAGARFAGYIVLRLPLAVAPLFEDWLGRHFPGKKERVLGRVRRLRGGKLYKAEWGERMKGQGIFADQIKSMFTVACRKAGILGRRPELSTAAFRRPSGTQRELFT